MILLCASRYRVPGQLRACVSMWVFIPIASRKLFHLLFTQERGFVEHSQRNSPRAALHNHYLQQLAKDQLLKIIYLFSSEQGFALLSFATGSGLRLFGPCIFSLLYSPRAGSRVKWVTWHPHPQGSNSTLNIRTTWTWLLLVNVKYVLVDCKQTIKTGRCNATILRGRCYSVSVCIQVLKCVFYYRLLHAGLHSRIVRMADLSILELGNSIHFIIIQAITRSTTNWIWMNT